MAATRRLACTRAGNGSQGVLFRGRIPNIPYCFRKPAALFSLSCPPACLLSPKPATTLFLTSASTSTTLQSRRTTARASSAFQRSHNITIIHNPKSLQGQLLLRKLHDLEDSHLVVAFEPAKADRKRSYRGARRAHHAVRSHCHSGEGVKTSRSILMPFDGLHDFFLPPFVHVFSIRDMIRVTCRPR